MQSSLVLIAWASKISIKITLVPDRVFIPTWQMCSLTSSLKDVAATFIIGKIARVDRGYLCQKCLCKYTMDVLLLQVYHWFNNPLGDTSFEAFFDAVSRIGDVRNGIPVQKLKSKAYKSAYIYKEQSDITSWSCIQKVIRTKTHYLKAIVWYWWI